MKTRNKLLTMLLLSTGAAGSISLINKTIRIFAASRHILEDSESLCYKWRFGNIHYTKRGNGKPILLIHNLNACFCGYEWKELERYLAESYTVYTIDLLGFGRSEKPNFTYTNYLYVQLLSDFIKSEIGHRTNIVTSGISSSIAIMACSSSPELFDQIFLINPESVVESSLYPGKNAKLYKFILDTPIIGSLIYNIAFSRSRIEKALAADYFYNPYSMHARYADAFYEAAHLGKSPKSVFASITCNYTRCSIANALKKIDNSICIICGSAHPANKELIREFKNCNPAVEAYIIQKSKLLPHMEKPADVYNLIKTI